MCIRWSDTQHVPGSKFRGDLVGALTDPIIVFPGGWGDTLPEWLKNAITLERLAMNMKTLKGEEVTGIEIEQLLQRHRSAHLMDYAVAVARAPLFLAGSCGRL